MGNFACKVTQLGTIVVTCNTTYSKYITQPSTVVARVGGCSIPMCSCECETVVRHIASGNRQTGSDVESV